MKTIVLSNQKGGVGKTTLNFNLGIWLASIGFKTLLIDADPQGNLTKSLVDSHSFGLYEALSGADYEAEEVKPGLYLLSGDVKLAGLEKSLIGELDAFTRLKELLSGELFQTFDFILIDSPPSLGVLTGNALTASDWLIIPMNPSLYSMQGTNDLMATVAKVRKNFNPNLQLLGVIINAYDSNPVITRQIHGEIREAFGEKVFQTSLSKSIRIEEAIAAKSGVISRPRVDGRPSRAAEEIKAIGEELLLRLGV
jgi:chromosome partitioning protein